MLVLTDSSDLTEQLTNQFKGKVKSRSLYNYAFSLVQKNFLDLGFFDRPKFIKESKNETLFYRSCEDDLSAIASSKLYSEYLSKGKLLNNAAEKLDIEYSSIYNVVQRFNKLKRTINVVYYPDLILFAWRLFKKLEKEELHIKIPELLLVEGFQDFNQREKKLIGLLGRNALTTIIIDVKRT